MEIQFDTFGNLLPGIHRLGLDEVMNRFATGTARREWLGEKLRTLVAVARGSGLVRRIYLWGSFVTAKPSPNDLDLLLVLKPGLTDDELTGPLRDLVDHERARLRFHADVFWVREDVGEKPLALLLETYGIDRDKRRRGIVEVRT